MHHSILHLHIGPSKTGTTTIQNALTASASELRAAGYFYPTFESNHQFLASAHMTAPENFDYNIRAGRSRKDLPTYHSSMLKLFEDQVAEAKCRNVVLSSEHLMRLNNNEFAYLAAYLKSIFSTIRVYGYIRHPLEQIGSQISERIKSGEYRLSDVHRDPPVRLYSLKLESLAAAFGREAILLHLFNPKEFVGGDLLSDFFHWIGAGEVPFHRTAERQNERLSYPAMLIADAMTNLAPRDSGRRLPKSYLHRIKGPEYQPPRDVVNLAMERMLPEIDYLKDEWGIVLPDAHVRTSSGAICGPETMTSIAEIMVELKNGRGNQEAHDGIPRKLTKTVANILNRLLQK